MQVLTHFPHLLVISLGLVVLLPTAHDAFFEFVGRPLTLVETSRLSIMWQFALKLARAKNTSGTERQHVNIPLSLYSVADVTASLGLYATM